MPEGNDENAFGKILKLLDEEALLELNADIMELYQSDLASQKFNNLQKYVQDEG